mmetsp:Transcript_41178/g.98617  ORF Transcript_41178/g.98617 Transcript_41178/m.98617 type:complete len:308 (-) Transcript_41178:2025-2948(-)
MGGGTFVDHMGRAVASFARPESEIDLDEVVEHPYLQEHCPERSRTLRDIIAYENDVVRNRLNYNDALKYKDGRISPVWQRISERSIDIAILDQHNKMMLEDCTSFPGSFKYLNKLEQIRFCRCSRSLTVPPGVLETMHRLDRLFFEQSGGNILNDLVGLPAVNDIYYTSNGFGRTDFSEPDHQLADFHVALGRLRNGGSKHSTFRKKVKGIEFSSFRFSDTVLSQLFLDITETFSKSSLSLHRSVFTLEAGEILITELREKMETDKQFKIQMEKCDLTYSSMFRYKEGLRNLIELLRLVDSINYVGN